MDDRIRYIGDPNYGVIVDFLSGQRPDWEGRWLAEIRTWDAEQLEDDHQYIQWLFPLATESEAVFAPILREYELTLIHANTILQGELIASLQQMLCFYGFTLVETESGIAVQLTNRLADRQQVWMTPGNHNYRRISRILGSLVLFGLKSHATAFLEALEVVYQQTAGKAAIEASAMWFWRQRAG